MQHRGGLLTPVTAVEWTEPSISAPGACSTALDPRLYGPAAPGNFPGHGTLRRELLDRILILEPGHLRRILTVDPTANLAGGQMYQASITLQGSGEVYLDFYNGEDLASETGQLTSTPVTLTLQDEVPGSCSTPLQVRTASAGPVDLYASGASIQLLRGPDCWLSQDPVRPSVRPLRACRRRG
jgi:hypothetical protein